MFGLDIEVTNQLRMTPLHNACSIGNATLAKFLIEKGALLERYSVDFLSPIALAANNPRFNFSELIPTAGSKTPFDKELQRFVDIGLAIRRYALLAHRWSISEGSFIDKHPVNYDGLDFRIANDSLRQSFEAFSKDRHKTILDTCKGISSTLTDADINGILSFTSFLTNALANQPYKDYQLQIIAAGGTLPINMRTGAADDSYGKEHDEAVIFFDKDRFMESIAVVGARAEQVLKFLRFQIRMILQNFSPQLFSIRMHASVMTDCTKT